MGDALRFRRARPEEWPRVRALRLRGLQTDPSAFGAAYAEEASLPDPEWRARFERVAWHVAEEGDAWLGLLGGRALDDGSRELVSLFVAPEARGRGVARALLDAGVAWARAEGASVVHLWSNVENAAAMRVYARAGFAPVGEPWRGTRDPTRAFQRMEKRV